nr:MAG TPA: hypothetical protein [Caudoviricetes sp.]
MYSLSVFSRRVAPCTLRKSAMANISGSRYPDAINGRVEKHPAS